MCSITGKHMRSVALDEAYEMLVNKDLKTTIIYPSKAYLDHMLFYYPVRSMVLNAVKYAILLDADVTKSSKVSVFDHSSLSAMTEDNVKCMVTKVQSSNTLDVLDEARPLTSEWPNTHSQTTN